MLMLRKKSNSPNVTFKSHTRKGVGNWILGSLLSMTRTDLLKLVDFSSKEKGLIVDLGCSIGYITRPLSNIGQVIGLDLDRNQIRWAKKFNRHIQFICCDLCHLPIRNDAVSIAVCASVLEHIEHLEQALKEIKYVLRQSGKLVVGYPIETRLTDIVISSFWKSESQTWDQSNVKRNAERMKNPHTHKQNFITIRKKLSEEFGLLEIKKVPKNYFPDLFSIYENAVFVNPK